MECFNVEKSGLNSVLSDDEFEYYFNLYKNGDIDARNIIIERNLKLVISIVNRKFASFHREKEDMISEGVIGLIKALKYYNLDGGAKFSTYATKCVTTSIAVYCANRIKTNGELLSLDKEYKNYNYDECENTLQNFAPHEDHDKHDLFEKKDYLNYLLDALTSYERDIIEMFYGIGKYNKPFTEKDIGKKYNCSKQWISVKINKILKDLKHCTESELCREQIMLKKGKILELSKGNKYGR